MAQVQTRSGNRKREKVDLLLTAIEHGALTAVMAIMWYHERQERIAANAIIVAQLQKCLDEQEQLIDEEFSPRNK